MNDCIMVKTPNLWDDVTEGKVAICLQYVCETGVDNLGIKNMPFAITKTSNYVCCWVFVDEGPAGATSTGQL